MRVDRRAFEDPSRNDWFPAPSGAQNERPSCLACGDRIGRDEPTIKIHGALVHLRCAVYRRRMARR
jgi:hypothetical protein